MNVRTLIVTATATMLLSACGGDGPSQATIEKHVRAEWAKDMETLKLFAPTLQDAAALDRQKLDIKLNACEAQGDKNTQKCKITLSVELDGEKGEKIITPTFKKEFDEWALIGGIRQ